MPTLYSHSRLATFEKCPKQFHYRYVLELPQETEGIEAFMGKRVHEILERLYEFTVQGMVPSLQKVLQRYETWWDEHFDEERVVVVRTGIPASHYRKLGARCLENYYNRHFPFDRDETLAVEETVIFDLDAAPGEEGAGDYRMQGIIDRVVEARDGSIEIQDYKTGRYIPSQKQLDTDRQLALYQIGLAHRFTGRRIRLVWHYLQQGEVRTSRRDPEQLAELREETMKLIDRVRSATSFPARRSKLCDWCEYKTPCFESEP